MSLTFTDIFCGAGESEVPFDGAPLQVLSGCPQSCRVVIEEPKSAVATATQDSADCSGSVAMIDRRAPNSTRSRHGLRGPADRAIAGLQAELGATHSLLLVMPVPPSSSEAATTRGSEGGRVRTPVGVGVSEGNTASGTVRSRRSHCSILAAQMAHWAGNAVSCNVAQWLGQRVAEVLA